MSIAHILFRSIFSYGLHKISSLNLIMDTKSRSYSNISLDSLEFESKKKSSRKEKPAGETVDTILVPFYENDVLIKVSKGNKKHRQMGNKATRTDAGKEEGQQCRSYLMNNNLQRGKKMSYLEMFRKQFSSHFNEKNIKDPNEIRSISPECGDTERESIGEEYNSNVINEFYNTEAYNEMYYDKLMNQELEQYLDQSLEEGLRFDRDIGSKSPLDIDDNNLRSVSEVSRPRRHVRRTTVPISENIQLGGLGPDMENIRPRLERAKSLQRYSEKVRMENRVKIYKKELMEAENEKKAEKEAYAKRRASSAVRSTDQKGKKSSYLVEKNQEKSSVIKKIYTKSKSQEVKGRISKDNDPANCAENIKEKEFKPGRVIERKLTSAKDNMQKYIKAGYGTNRKKSSARSHSNTEQRQISAVSPVEIRFTVNVGGIRPSSALKSLEEKHRIYQEKVKRFTMNSNNA